MIRQYWSGNVITGVGRIRDGLKFFKGGNFWRLFGKQCSKMLVLSMPVSFGTPTPYFIRLRVILD